MNKSTNPGMQHVFHKLSKDAQRRRACNEYAVDLLYNLRACTIHPQPFRHPHNMSDFYYFKQFQRIASTMMVIIKSELPLL